MTTSNTKRCDACGKYFDEPKRRTRTYKRKNANSVRKVFLYCPFCDHTVGISPGKIIRK